MFHTLLLRAVSARGMPPSCRPGARHVGVAITSTKVFAFLEYSSRGEGLRVRKAGIWGHDVGETP